MLRFPPPPPGGRVAARLRRLARRPLVPVAATVLAIACGDAGGGAARGASPSAAAADPALAGSALADSALADTLARRLVDAYDLSRDGVVQRLMALYPDSGPVISAAAGRVTTSRFALRGEIERFWQRIGQNMQQPRFVVAHRWATRLGPDAAVVTLEYRIPHLTPQGRPHTLAGAWTAVFQRRRGEWVIVQEHLSDVPAAPPADLARPSSRSDSASAARPTP